MRKIFSLLLLVAALLLSFLFFGLLSRLIDLSKIETTTTNYLIGYSAVPVTILLLFIFCVIKAIRIIREEKSKDELSN